MKKCKCCGQDIPNPMSRLVGSPYLMEFWNDSPTDKTLGFLKKIRDDEEDKGYQYSDCRHLYPYKMRDGGWYKHVRLARNYTHYHGGNYENLLPDNLKKQGAIIYSVGDCWTYAGSPNSEHLAWYWSKLKTNSVTGFKIFD